MRRSASSNFSPDSSRAVGTSYKLFGEVGRGPATSAIGLPISSPGIDLLSAAANTAVDRPRKRPGRKLKQSDMYAEDDTLTAHTRHRLRFKEELRQLADIVCPNDKEPTLDEILMSAIRAVNEATLQIDALQLQTKELSDRRAKRQAFDAQPRHRPTASLPVQPIGNCLYVLEKLMFSEIPTDGPGLNSTITQYFYSFLFHQSCVPLVMLTPTGSFLDANEQFAAQLGLHPSALTGINILDLLISKSAFYDAVQELQCSTEGYCVANMGFWRGPLALQADIVFWCIEGASSADYYSRLAVSDFGSMAALTRPSSSFPRAKLYSSNEFDCTGFNLFGMQIS